MPRGPAPKPPEARKRTNKPVHEWRRAPGDAWRHGGDLLVPAGSSEGPVHVGGGYYELPDGRRVRGRKAAEAEVQGVWIPSPPDGLRSDARDLWCEWFTSWPASFWERHQLGEIRVAIETYDGTRRGSVDVAKLGPLLDRLGLTLPGQRNLRMLPPDPSSSPGDDRSANDGRDELAERREQRARRIT